MKVNGIKQGIPSWVELATTDEPAALSFYSALFGWDDDPQPMGEGMGDYHMQMVEGDMVAAISAQQAMEREQGVPPHWNIYLAVDNADETMAKVAGAGGSVVVEPMDVFESGRMAFMADPTGGIVGVWQANQHQGFGRIREPNTVTWCELVTDDPKTAAAFYTAVLDVPAEENAMDGGPPYTLLGPTGEQGAGILQKRDDMGPAMPNTWLAYFESADTDASAARIKELGGNVLMEPWDVPGVGRIAVVADPQGAVFGLVKSVPMAM